MKFTRENLLETIIFILESSVSKTLSTIELFIEISKLIKVDNIHLQFQYMMTLNNIKNFNLITINNNIVKLNKESNEDVNYEYDFKIEKSNNILKEILIDIKDNYHIYSKFNSDDLFNQLINLI